MPGLGRALAAAFVLFLAQAGMAAAQVPGLPPGVTPQDLMRRPDLVQQLRQQLQSSGLTPDQVRARLRAAGYPESLLDAYLPGADSTRAARPAPRTIDAMRALGLLSPEQADSLQTSDSLATVSDSLRRIADSLRLRRADSLRADSLADSLAARGQLKLFGLEVFRRTSTRFQAAQAGPVDENYRLGPGDVLVLILTGDVESTQQLEVTREGFVVIPQVGQVYVANLTLAQLRDVLYTRLGRAYSGVRRGPGARTQFAVTVARLRNIQVFVTGDVVRPGSYQISAAGTVLTALYAAGGPTANGSFRRVLVQRGGRTVDSLDVYDYLLRGDNGGDARLQTGDVVFVPVHGAFVKAAGEIARPAIYELKPDETLGDLIRFGGGFAPTAYQARAQIHRILPASSRAAGGASRVVVDVGADQFAGGAAPPVPLVPGDSVTIFPVADRVTAFVRVRGNVWIEGPVGFHPGMTLSEAIRLAGGPKPDVYLDRILVTRTHADSSREQLRSAFADSTGRVVSDLTLSDQDLIEVFPRSAFLPQVYVTVTGAVNRSGRIPYREGMTLRDAVLIAGGLDEGADLREAEIARIAERRTSSALAETVRVPLDSTYLFDRFRRAGYQGAPGYPAPASGAPEVALRPYDNVLILRQPGWDVQRLVYLTGQVKHPGRYALRSKTERLSDLVERAGGLTDEAYAAGVEFFRIDRFQRERAARREVEERHRQEQLNGRGAGTMAEAGRGATAPGGATGRALPLVASGTTRTPPTPQLPVQEDVPAYLRGRVGVDLVRAMRKKGSPDDLILVGGDSINVPEFDPIVTVTGAVNSPGQVAYEPGRNLDWYVRAAGGYGARSDDGRAYVTQPNGKKDGVKRRFLADYVPKPGPGALVYVPEKDLAVPKQPSQLPAILSTVVGAITGLVTTIVVLTR
ncbi:MAG TPA: SLBB domain-containing protein [Gemmatimonadales bacterium]|nr:SLBB domain-containing protein [Gemmatimonadales bacterium]